MKRLAVILSLCFGVWMLGVHPAEAGRRWRFTPSVSATTTYNDNVQYLGKGDVEFQVAPGLKLEIDSERTEHTFRAGLSHYKYADLHRLDRTTQKYSWEIEHAATERLTLFSDLRLANDYTLGSSEEETGEVATKARREQLSWTGRAQFQLTERTLVGLQYGYTSRQYARQYVDTVGHSLSGDVAWAATERLTLLGAVSTQRVNSEFQDGGSGAYGSLGFSGGFRYALTEIFTAFANVGNQWTRNDLQTNGLDGVRNDSGRTVDGGVEWEYERSNGRLTYARDTTTSLNGATLDRDHIEIEHDYRTTERSTLRLRGGLTNSKSNGLLSNTESFYWNLGTSWRYSMTEDHQFVIGATHHESENKITNKQHGRNVYFLRFNFNFPQEWTLGGARY